MHAMKSKRGRMKLLHFNTLTLGYVVGATNRTPNKGHMRPKETKASCYIPWDLSKKNLAAPTSSFDPPLIFNSIQTGLNFFFPPPLARLHLFQHAQKFHYALRTQD
jgi:hypothetical protein